MIKVGRKTQIKGEKIERVIPLMKEVYREYKDAGTELSYRQFLIEFYTRKRTKHLFKARSMCINSIKKFYDYLEFLEGKEKEEGYNLRSLQRTHHDYLIFLKAVGEEEKLKETELQFFKQKARYLRRDVREVLERGKEGAGRAGKGS